MKDATFWIKHLGLRPHPEGGYFGEVYRSGEQIAREALPERYSKAHAFATSIYFLLPGDQISALHRLKSDEIWHFYSGSSVRISMIFADGTLRQKTLGPTRKKGKRFRWSFPGDVGSGQRSPMKRDMLWSVVRLLRGSNLMILNWGSAPLCCNNSRNTGR